MQYIELTIFWEEPSVIYEKAAIPIIYSIYFNAKKWSLFAKTGLDICKIHAN